MPLVKLWQLLEHQLKRDVHHRKWGWADEQGWDNFYVLPLTGRAAKDGVAGPWEKLGVVLSYGATGEPDERGVHQPHVIYRNGKFYLYHSRRAADGTYDISLATASNPEGPFTKTDLTIIPRGSAGEFDEKNADGPSVVYDGKWHMIYTGIDAAGARSIGYAYSDDGLSWTKYGKLLAPTDYFRFAALGRFGKIWAIVYTDSDLNLKLWMSDEITVGWTDQGVILTKEVGKFDEKALQYSSFWWNQGVWFIFYMGADAYWARRIGMARSLDGWSWSKYKLNPVIARGATGEWDDDRVAKPSLLMIDRTFYLYYSGWKTGVEKFEIGLARLKLEF